jgi:uncharacterized protein YggE
MSSTNLAYLRDQEARCRDLASTTDHPELAKKMRAAAEQYAQRIVEILRVGMNSQPMLMQMPRHQGSPPVKKTANTIK